MTAILRVFCEDLYTSPRSIGGSLCTDRSRLDDDGNHLAGLQRMRRVSQHFECIPQNGPVSSHRHVCLVSLRTASPSVYSHISLTPLSLKTLSRARRARVCIPWSSSRQSGFHSSSSSVNPSSIANLGNRFCMMVYDSEFRLPLVIRTVTHLGRPDVARVTAHDLAPVLPHLRRASQQIAKAMLERLASPLQRAAQPVPSASDPTRLRATCGARLTT